MAIAIIRVWLQATSGRKLKAVSLLRDIYIKICCNSVAFIKKHILVIIATKQSFSSLRCGNKSLSEVSSSLLNSYTLAVDSLVIKKGADSNMRKGKKKWEREAN